MAEPVLLEARTVEVIGEALRLPGAQCGAGDGVLKRHPVAQEAGRELAGAGRQLQLIAAQELGAPRRPGRGHRPPPPPPPPPAAGSRRRRIAARGRWRPPRRWRAWSRSAR